MVGFVAIVMNVPCPACQERGHDQRGSNMMVFSDGSRYCNRAHWHKDGSPLFIPADADDPVMNMEITGTIKYTPDQFRELEKEGKLGNPEVRAVALEGMRGEDRWEVSTKEEKKVMLESVERDHEYFNMLKVRNLAVRHIRGDVAKFYDVRTGLGPDARVNRYYYPIYDKDSGEWKGAKCRNLPKDFRYGHLGFMWGRNLLHGQELTSEVIASGARMDQLLLVGGQDDMLAAQQMILDSREGTKWAGIKAHVWSPTKGESAIEEIVLNKDEINKFKRILVCFDDDEVGNKLNLEVSRLFRGKVVRVQMPSGCKDPNDCLSKGRAQEFIDAWFNPVDLLIGGKLCSLSKFRDKAKTMPTMGLSWPWPSMDPITFAIRPYYLCVWGMGTGVGKTKMTKSVCLHLAYEHNQNVATIFLEEPPHWTLRAFAGELINKDLNSPPINDKNDPNYEEMLDYTEEEANAAIDRICDDSRIFIGDLKGSKEVDAVMEVMEEALALGFKHFAIDNLSAFKHSSGNKKGTETNAIDETMRRLGTFKDENPVFILLLSHLNRPGYGRTPHELGGPVELGDFRGAGSITFWANGVFGGYRNTKAPTIEEKCYVVYENIKNREAGYKVGSKVHLSLSLDTGKLSETDYRPPDPDDFDDGTKPRKASAGKYDHDSEF